MLSRHITRSFARLVKPKISNYPDVFKILSEKETTINNIEEINKKTLSNHKHRSFSDKIG